MQTFLEKKKKKSVTLCGTLSVKSVSKSSLKPENGHEIYTMYLMHL